jgi:hypothetical protein
MANIYLHYVFDQWADRWRHYPARGQVIIVRYADDIVVGFEHKAQAEQFLVDLRQRMEKFALTLHPEKTRLIEFGRFATPSRAKRGLGKPETFNFLGFTHICGRSARGRFVLMRRSRRDRMRAKLRAIKEALRRRMHLPIPQVGKWLGQVVRGYFNYHAVPTNTEIKMHHHPNHDASAPPVALGRARLRFAPSGAVFQNGAHDKATRLKHKRKGPS